MSRRSLPTRMKPLRSRKEFAYPSVVRSIRAGGSVPTASKPTRKSRQALGHRPLHGQPSQHRSLGIVFVRGRCAKERHKAIAQMASHMATIAQHTRFDPLMDAIDQLVQLLGIEGFAQGSAAHQIGKQDGDQPPLLLGRRCYRGHGRRRHSGTALGGTD